MTRDEACAHVAKLITGDRNETHGSAVLQLTNVQQIKAAVGHRDNPKLPLAVIEAMDMICVKLSRAANGTPIEDHFLDIIGYAAIAVEALSLYKIGAPTAPASDA